jgi:hypothetical protein
MNIYKARYTNALKMAAKVNRYLKKGYQVFHRGEPTKHGFIFQDNQILLKHGEGFYTIYYENSKDWDHGYYTKISEYNNRFTEDFQVFMLLKA